MKELRNLAIFTILAVFTSNLHAVNLKWTINQNDRLEIVKTAEVDFFINNGLEKSYSERNIIDLTCYKKSKNEQFLRGVFSLYQKDQNETVFKKFDSYNSDFSIMYDGHYIVPEKNIMPNERNIPTFPQKELMPGDTWSAPAQIILNGFRDDIVLDISVNYKLEQIKETNQNSYAVISYSYSYKKNFLTQNINPNDFSEDEIPPPNGIVIQNQGVFLWNLSQNIPVTSEDNYYTAWLYIQSIDSYSIVEHKMKMKATYKIYHTVTEDQKEKEKRELEQNLSNEKGISVSKNTSGLVIRMGEILFDFNSSLLKQETEPTLKKICKIIKEKYPESEIIIEGHTDNIGSDDYNQTLSEKRAKTVAGYIKQNIEHDKISYKGYGKTKPLNTNKDENERQLNRRVDIIIKLN